MIGRTNFGHDHDADAIRHLLERAEIDEEKARASMHEASTRWRMVRRQVDDLKRRLLRVEHKSA